MILPQTVRLSRLADSPSQPRSAYHQLDELAASIRTHGVLQPILCRPITDRQIGSDPAQDLEIVAGHRRVRAAELAYLDEIPATIRPMTDLEVLQVQIVENLQREDVSPLDEARAYASLRDGHGQTSAQIAATIGTSVRHVQARISLTTLTGAALDAVRDGRIGAEIGVLISALPPTLHDRAVFKIRILDETTNETRTASLRQARQILRQSKLVMPIMSAPFEIFAPSLIDCAGACTACPSNSTHMGEQAQADLGADICTDPTCYAAKLAAHTVRELGNLADNGWTILDAEPEAGTWKKLEGECIDTVAKACAIDYTQRAHCIAWPDDVTGLHAKGVTAKGYTAMLRLIHPTPAPPAARSLPEGEGGDTEEDEGTTVATKRDTSDQEPTTLAPEGGEGARESLRERICWSVMMGNGWPPQRSDLILVCAALAINASRDALAMAGLPPVERVGAAVTLDEITRWPDNVIARTCTVLAIMTMSEELPSDRQVSLLTQLHTRYLGGGEGDQTSHGSAAESEDETSLTAGEKVTDETPLTGRDQTDDACASARPTTTAEARYEAGLLTKRKPSSARYQCPTTGQTWTGRGLKPRWLVQALDEGGKTLTDFDTLAQGTAA